MSSGTRRGRLIAGIVVLVVGIVGAVGLWLGANARLDAAVDGLARGPVGCDTVLDFDETGDYVVFIETKGAIDDGRGDCDADTSVDWSSDELPAATVTITGPDGDEVDDHVRRRGRLRRRGIAGIVDRHGGHRTGR